MKLIAIGDTHGSSLWKLIIHKQPCDKLIFIGDYFDSFDIRAKEQLHNFEEILSYKRANPDKVVLLTGNHDFHYMPAARSRNETYTGFQDRYAFQIGDLLEQCKDLLQVCYRWENYLFTHAGVTKTWMDRHGYEGEDAANFINDLFRYQPRSFFFDGNDPYGDDVTQSPLWVRPPSLKQDAFRPEIFKQVVGHTSVRRLTMVEDRLFFIDTLNTSGEYLLIEEGMTYIQKL
jgi:Calcineurin-like phosphoesterase